VVLDLAKGKSNVLKGKTRRHELKGGKKKKEVHPKTCEGGIVCTKNQSVSFLEPFDLVG